MDLTNYHISFLLATGIGSGLDLYPNLANENKVQYFCPIISGRHTLFLVEVNLMLLPSFFPEGRILCKYVSKRGSTAEGCGE